jgi:Ras family protein T1
VKDVVREKEAAGVNENGLTEVGFAYLHSLFIRKGRPETTWTVLRQFGYGDDLSLRQDFLLPPFEVPPECSVELGPLGYFFLTELFQAFHKVMKMAKDKECELTAFYDLQDKDGALTMAELDELFSTSPGNPWQHTAFPHTTITTETDSVTLQGWLAQWR